MEIPGGDRCPCSWIIPGERQLSGFTKTWVYPIVASFPAVESLGFLLIFRLLFGDRCASHNVVWHDEHVSWWRAAWHAAINNCRWKRTSGLTVFHQSGHGQVLLSARYRNATAQVRTDDLARPHTSAHACRCRPSSYFGTYRTLIDAQSQLHSEGDMKFSSCMECGVLLAVSWPCVHVVRVVWGGGEGTCVDVDCLPCSCSSSSTVPRITPIQLTTVRREQNRPNTSVMSRTQLKQRLQKEITELEERRELSPAPDLEGGVASRLGIRPMVLGQGTAVVGVPVSVFQVSDVCQNRLCSV